MREIKFRAWDKRFERYAKAENIRLNLATGETHGKHSSGNVDDWELEQYTGLKDKNGVEIYEGDILETSNSDDPFYEIVEWGTQEWTPNNIPLCDTEIIGNIHEDAPCSK